MRCERCGWPVEDAERVSTHMTSEGWVHYRRCVCGAVFVELARPATPVTVSTTTNGTLTR